MLRILSKELNSGTLIATQNKQYSDKIILTDTVPANSTKLGLAAVTNLGHFYCLFITGHFETLKADIAGTIDNGVCTLRSQLIDGAGQRKLFSDYIPLDLLLSPGRAKSNAAINNLGPVGPIGQADPGFPLFYPGELEYVFSANSNILLDTKNLSDVDQTYEVVFHGIRLLY